MNDKFSLEMKVEDIDELKQCIHTLDVRNGLLRTLMN